MRSSALLVLLASCQYTDVTRAIGLVPSQLTPMLDDDLAEAAACWNLRFGVHFVTGSAAASAAQQVEVFFDDTTCLDAPAQVQAGWPEKLAMCPLRYWPALESDFPPMRFTPFRVLSHELGHLLNIIEHPDDPLAVMRSGGGDGVPMFRDADIQLFEAANPDFVVESSCSEVIRSTHPDPNSSNGVGAHCRCGH